MISIICIGKNITAFDHLLGYEQDQLAITYQTGRKSC